MKNNSVSKLYLKLCINIYIKIDKHDYPLFCSNSFQIEKKAERRVLWDIFHAIDVMR